MPGTGIKALITILIKLFLGRFIIIIFFAFLTKSSLLVIQNKGKLSIGVKRWTRMEPGHEENTGSTTLVMYYLPSDIPKRGILNILTTFTTRVVVWNKNDFKTRANCP